MLEMGHFKTILFFFYQVYLAYLIPRVIFINFINDINNQLNEERSKGEGVGVIAVWNEVTERSLYIF